MVSLGYGPQGRYGGSFQSMADLINNIITLKQLQRENLVMEDFRNKLSNAKTGDDLITLLSTAPNIPQRTGLARLIEPINPFVASRTPSTTEKNLTSTFVNEAVRQRLREPVGIEREALESQIGERKARAKYYEQGGARMNIRITTPLSPQQRTKYEDEMEAYIDSAKKTKRGGYNYTKENLLSAWEKFKEDYDYDSMADNRKAQIRAWWNDTIGRRNQPKLKGLVGGGEYEWDPSMIETPVGTASPSAHQGGPARPGEQAAVPSVLADRRGLTDIPPGLESIWGQMNDDEKQTAQMAIEQGLEASEIIDYFNRNR